MAQTSDRLVQRLRSMWREGSKPTEMIEYMKTIGVTAPAIGFAFGDAFGVKMRHKQIATGWSLQLKGTSEEKTNHIITEAIAQYYSSNQA